MTHLQWQRAPIIKLTLPLAIGAFSARYITTHWSILDIVLLAFLFTSLHRHLRTTVDRSSQRVCSLIGALLLFQVGAFYTQTYLREGDDCITKTPKRHQVVRIVKVKEFSAQKSLVEAQLLLDDSFMSISGRIVSFVPRIMGIKEGSVIVWRPEPNRIEERAPFEFNTKDYYANKGIFYQQNLEYIALLKSSVGRLQSARAIAKQLQGFLSGRFSRTPQPFKGIMMALVLGEKDELTPEIRKLFSKCGLAHWLTVSGMHVGAVFLFITWAMKFVRLHNSLRVIGTLTLVWIYALITGMGAPVQRASLMASLFVLGNLNGQKGSSLNSLLASGLLLYLQDPLILFQLGFQLSFLAVLGILLFHGSLRSLLHSKNQGLDKVLDLSLLSISAQVLIFPLLLFHFRSFPTYGILINVLLSAYLLLAFYGSILVLLIADIQIMVSKVLQFILEFLNMASGWPYSSFHINIERNELLVIYLALLTWTITVNRRRFLLPWTIGILLMLTIGSRNKEEIYRYRTEEGTAYIYRRQDEAVLLGSAKSVQISLNKVIDKYTQHYGVAFWSYIHPGFSSKLITRTWTISNYSRNRPCVGYLPKNASKF